MLKKAAEIEEICRNTIFIYLLQPLIFMLLAKKTSEIRSSPENSQMGCHQISLFWKGTQLKRQSRASSIPKSFNVYAKSVLNTLICFSKCSPNSVWGGLLEHLGSLLGTILAPRRIRNRFRDDFSWIWTSFWEVQSINKLSKFR